WDVWHELSDGFGTSLGTKLGQRCRQQPVRHAETGIGWDAATAGIRRFFVAPAQEMSGGQAVVGKMVQPVERADPKRAFCPFDRTIRLAAPRYCHAARE